MNNQLIPVAPRPVGAATIQTVDARELHSFLEVSSRFNDWIINRIKDFSFVENQDFVTFTKNLVNGGKTKEYALSLSMGKELSMVERNAKGKQARLYFIECEDKVKALPAIDFSDPAFLRTTLLSYTEKVLALESTVSTLQPKAAALDLITISEGSMCISNAAKVLDFQKVKDCFAWLHEIEWIFRRSGDWIAHQDKVRTGLLEVKTFSYDSTDGSKRTKDQTLITAKGLAQLSLLRQNQNPSAQPSSAVGGEI